MKIRARSSMAASLLVFVSPLLPAASAATLERLRIGYPSPSANFYPLFATKRPPIREVWLRTGNDLCSGCSINRCAGSRAVGFLVGFWSGFSPGLY